MLQEESCAGEKLPAWYHSESGRRAVQLSEPAGEWWKTAHEAAENDHMRWELHMLFCQENEYGAFWQRCAACMVSRLS